MTTWGARTATSAVIADLWLVLELLEKIFSRTFGLVIDFSATGAFLGRSRDFLVAGLTEEL